MLPPSSSPPCTSQSDIEDPQVVSMQGPKRRTDARSRFKPRNSNRDDRGQSEVSENEKRRLRSAGRSFSTNTQIFIMGLATFIVLLYKYRYHFHVYQKNPSEALAAIKQINLPKVCVKKSAERCQIYHCNNDKMVRSITSTGYAGKFVQRDADVARQRMQSGGSANWGSGCVISDEYKFVYLHVLKSGGSATKEFLRKSLCGEEDPDCKRGDKHVVRPISCKEATIKYSHYFFFSFGRNPFSRMFSMYSMMDGFPPKTKSRRVGRRLSTADFSFSDFVLKPKERRRHTSMASDHYTPQTNFLFSQNGCPAFDFLGRVEHFDEDIKTIIHHLKATKLISYFDRLGEKVNPVNTWGSDKKNKMGGDLRAAYNSKEVVDGVVSGYKDDFELLGYNTSVIPTD